MGFAPALGGGGVVWVFQNSRVVTDEKFGPGHHCKTSAPQLRPRLPNPVPLLQEQVKFALVDPGCIYLRLG